ncbi:aldehyde dehydrogenase family protein [Propionibacteriaceae bacterium Y1700]|uniref:aldehyde dehydrogenase family protein n=1 Tax=Microlunatus sp. Y1700 TaxID=3418487 RepID=UPI003DA70760
MTTTTPADLRTVFESGRTRPLEWRRAQLDGLHRLLVEHGDELAAALHQDLGKPATESWLTEIGELINAITHTEHHLAEWVLPRRVGVPAHLLPATAKVRHEPKGVVLVIAPWNYPLQLLLSPLIGALAAGNAVILKPSELSTHTADAIARLVPEYLDREAVTVVTGGPEVTTELIKAKVDHIFFTGSTRVGKLIMAAAVEHLTPVTLELGGKSPTYVHDDVNLTHVANRIAWGKFMNCGQTCVAPDHVLVHHRVHDQLVTELAAAIERMYGSDPRSSEAYGRLISTRHTEELIAKLPQTGIVTGGQHEVSERYVAPTVVTEVDPEGPLMAEEIFGPILPVIAVQDVDEAVNRMNRLATPLAMYLFAEDSSVTESIMDRTASGGVGIGVPVAHLSVPDLPFGGLGPSGMGAYHGRDSFDVFTHRRAVLRKPLAPDTLRMIYPPFTGLVDTMIRRIIAPQRRGRLRNDRPHHDDQGPSTDDR